MSKSNKQGLNLVSSIVILGIKWKGDITQTILEAEHSLITSFIFDTKLYYNSLFRLLDRARFLNIFMFSKLYYKMQLFPLSSRFWTQIHRRLFYVAWKYAGSSSRDIISPIEKSEIN